jgi:hypothetical protein
MKDRLKKKLKAKKILGNNQRHSKPVVKKEYEMPEYYKDYLNKLVEMIDEQEQYKKILPTLPPDVRAEALPVMRQLDKAIEAFEQKMADEYRDFQKRSQRIEETEKEKEETKAILFENMQRMFIVAKHKFEPAKFKEYEAHITRNWEPDFKEEFYELVAHRESYDLENILADPDGRVRRPMKNPQIQLKEALFDIARVAYVTPDDFKELEAEYERILAIRERADMKLWIIDPEHRPAKRRQIEELDKQLDEFKPKLMEYLETCFAETGKIEVRHPDQKKLDAAFAQADVASERVHLMYKHVLPHLYEGFVETSFRDMTPEEIKAAQARIAKREAEELDKILASCGIQKDKE